MLGAAFVRSLIFLGRGSPLLGAGQLGTAFGAIYLTAITEGADMHQVAAPATSVDTG